ncbi:complement C1q-like protein 4 [Argopecten irradians]|uniref:complement C1q-like protein 4 n=1 Tax=Argopecten irradians TaxID=31199 RepID=UPI003724BC06
MAVSVTNIGVWMLFILGSGNLIIADNVEHRLGWLEELAAKVETTVDTNIDQLGKIDQRLHRLQHGATQEKVKLRRATDPVIGFDTQLHLRAAGSHLHNQQALIFNHVRTNQGGAYNAANGKFTCPQHGLYQFATTISSISRGFVDCEMVMDGTHVGRLHANRPGFDQASQVLVLECSAGQKIWIRHVNGGHDSGIVSDYQDTSSFSGHLITTL